MALIPTVKTHIKGLVGRVANHLADMEAHDIPRVLQRRALEQTADFVTAQMPMVQPYADKFALFDTALQRANRQGLFCEFGVYRGESLNYMAARLPDVTFYGFDSFEGLPEDWRPDVRAGHFKLPEFPVMRNNVRLVKGWFDHSLEPFLQEHPEHASWLHIDSDLYSSAATVLRLFAPRIQPGTVIIFDEFFNYPGWQEGEYKAFTEFVSMYEVGFEYIGYSSKDEQVAVVIRELRKPR